MVGDGMSCRAVEHALRPSRSRSPGSHVRALRASRGLAPSRVVLEAQPRVPAAEGVILTVRTAYSYWVGGGALGLLPAGTCMIVSVGRRVGDGC